MDFTTARLWQIAVTAERFHLSPLQAMRDLEADEDDGVIMECLTLLNYADRKRTFDNAKTAKELARYDGDPLMDAVQQNEFDLVREGREEH